VRAETIPNNRGVHAQLLTEGANAFGLRLSSAQVHALQTYLSHLMTWNQRLNLTSIRDPELMVRRHLIDCIAVVPSIRPTGHLMDVGSGAGLPGIPIKVLHPDKEVTLLEPRRKRANFLRHVIRALGLTGIRVLEERINVLKPDQLQPLDEIIARAFTDNEGFLRAGSALLAPKGTCVLMHGPTGLEFLEKTRHVLQALGLEALPPKIFTLPFGGEHRTVLFFKKT